MTEPQRAPSLETSTHANADRGSDFAASLKRDQQHREKSKSLKPLRRLLPFVFAYPGTLALFVVMLALSSGIALLLPIVARIVVDCGFGSGEINADCISLPFGAGLSSYFIGALVLAFAMGASSALRFFFISKIGERVVADIRKAVYNHIMTLSQSFFANVRTGEVLSRLTTDTTLIQTLIGSSFSFAIRTIATSIGAIVMMLITNWQMTLMVLALGPMILLPLVMFGRRTQRLSRDSQDRLADASARASESLRAIDTVQAFTREDKEQALFGDAVETTYRASLARIVTRSMMTFTLFTFVLSGMVFILWFGATQVQNGSISPGEMTQFLIYAVMAVSGGGVLTEAYAEIMRAAGATERLMELLASETDIQAPVSPAKLPSAIHGNVRLEGVDFRYPSRPESKALDGFDLKVEPGQTVALVGPSGAGKSTVFQLLLRMYDPAAGTVTLEGHALNELDPEDVRQSIAVVSQNAPLFAGSVRDNILFGRDGAIQDDVIAAAKAANAHDFIMALPQGYDSMLGEGASNLSGGQRQRIAIARAILRDAPILMLDEATSALDSESEAAIQDAFERISATRTSIVIAHRLATVREADKIVVMDDGRAVEQGTHDELIAKGGLYARLVELQFGASH